MALADSGRRGGRALGAAEMLMESTGELGSELEKRAQPQTGVLGLSGASMGKERAASLLLRLLPSAQLGTALGRGRGAVGSRLPTFPCSCRGTEGMGTDSHPMETAP